MTFAGAPGTGSGIVHEVFPVRPGVAHDADDACSADEQPTLTGAYTSASASPNEPRTRDLEVVTMLLFMYRSRARRLGVTPIFAIYFP
jgi:hypothetical protein